MKLFNLPSRLESHEQYEANRAINTLISQSFVSSVSKYVSNETTTEPYTTAICTIETPFFVNSIKAIPAGDLEYSSTTLRDSGCAVFCFNQGLTTRRIYADLEDLAEEIAKKGYYEPDKGTWHCLFDHFGLRRASHYVEIIDALMRGTISTCLVSNALYHNDPNRCGKHFVNIVGVDKSKALIDDSNCGRIIMDLELFLKAVQIAWIW